MSIGLGFVHSANDFERTASLLCWINSIYRR